MEEIGLTSLVETMRLEMQSVEYRKLLSNIGEAQSDAELHDLYLEANRLLREDEIGETGYQIARKIIFGRLDACDYFGCDSGTIQ